jgi:hypothetical protein
MAKTTHPLTLRNILLLSIVSLNIVLMIKFLPNLIWHLRNPFRPDMPGQVDITTDGFEFFTDTLVLGSIGVIDFIVGVIYLAARHPKGES